METAVHFSSSTIEVATPLWLFDQLDAEFKFNLDPCCTHRTAKCKRHFTKKENGLSHSWGGASVFMNPPYGQEIGRWMEKAYTEALENRALVVCLVPARTDTRWWHNFAMKGEVRFLRGRIRFEGAESSAPFPSAIVIFRPGKRS